MSEFLDQSGLSTYSTLVRSSITAARPTVILVTLKSTGWTNKTQTVTVAGISSDEAAQRIIPIAHADSRSAYNEAGCKGVGQGEGSLTFECETVPSVDLKVWVEVKNVKDTTFYAPVKGSIISMDLDGQGAKQYRVLNMNGDVAKVMAMYDDLSSVWDADYPTTTMGTLSVAKYEGSTIDTYLNTTWYNTLTSATKAAIVPENVVCDAWYWDNSGDPDYTGTYGTAVPGTSNYTISKYAGGTLNIGNRNVFALSVQDVIDYLNDSSVQVDTTAILRNTNIWKMFWNDGVSHSGKSLWLRSSYAVNSNSAWTMNSYKGFLYYNPANYSNVVRLTLNLNLSQVPFTLIETPVIETETWYLNNSITILDSPVSINFVSNSTNFTTISFTRKGPSMYIKYDDTTVGEVELLTDIGDNKHYTSWTNEAYRTITLASPATGDLLTWLQKNAVKQ